MFEQQWEQAALESVLEELCDEISVTNARILLMRLIDHSSVDEVASEPNLAPQQIHARQHRPMKMLRAPVALYTGGPLGS